VARLCSPPRLSPSGQFGGGTVGRVFNSLCFVRIVIFIVPPKHAVRRNVKTKFGRFKGPRYFRPLFVYSGFYVQNDRSAKIRVFDFIVPVG